MIEAKRINLSVPPARLKKIRKFAQDHSMFDAPDATVCSNMICFLLALYDDPDIESYLSEHNATILDLIKRSLKSYLS